MNKNRRARLRTAVRLLGQAASIVDSVCDEERDSLGNMPENLQDSDRCKAMDDAISDLEDAASSISEASECIERACDAG